LSPPAASKRFGLKVIVREALHVEEVRAAQMLIALGLVGVDTRLQLQGQMNGLLVEVVK